MIATRYPSHHASLNHNSYGFSPAPTHSHTSQSLSNTSPVASSYHGFWKDNTTNTAGSGRSLNQSQAHRASGFESQTANNHFDSGRKTDAMIALWKAKYSYEAAHWQTRSSHAHPYTGFVSTNHSSMDDCAHSRMLQVPPHTPTGFPFQTPSLPEPYGPFPISRMSNTTSSTSSNASSDKSNSEIKFRQLPCRTWISTGTCPYNDKCVFLHDRRCQSKILPNAPKKKSKEDIRQDCFFWPAMPRNRVNEVLDQKKCTVCLAFSL